MTIDNTFSWPGYHPEEAMHRLIASYLAVDIQKDIKETRNLLKKIDAVGARKIPNWERIGNAYFLRLYPEYAQIEEEFSDESNLPDKIPLPLFKSAVLSWKQHIST